MARLPNFLVIIRSEKLSGKGQGRGGRGAKKRTFRFGKKNVSFPKVETFRFADYIWKEYIKPMEGKYVSNSKGSNKIIEVNDLELKRCSINNRISKIDRDSFKFAYEYLVKNGSVTRDYINQQIDKRCSSIIYYVLAQIPFVEMKISPKQILILKTK